MGLVLILLAVFALPAGLALANVVAPHVVNVSEAWALACKLEQVDCSKIPQPKIVGRHLFQEYGAFGAFGLEPLDTIYVDDQLGPMLADVLLESVISHEMTHYLDYQIHGIDWMRANGCQTEWNGWRAGNAYLVSHGRPDLADYNWQERYGCFGAGSDE